MNEPILSSAFQWQDAKEIYTFMAKRFNVNAARRLIERAPRPVIQVDIHQAPVLLHRIDKDKVEAADISFPVILIATLDGPWIIDGWHRVAKAQQQNIVTLPAVQLTENETKEIAIGVMEGILIRRTPKCLRR